MISLEYLDQVKYGIDKRFFEDMTKKAYNVLQKKIDGMLGFCDGVIALILVDDKEITHINHSHRGKNQPTDVVSLSYIEATSHPEEFPTGFEMVGEIFISLDTAKKQAVEKGHSLEKELEFLFVHGFLHVFGFDHNTDEEESEMESYAQKIIGS